MISAYLHMWTFLLNLRTCCSEATESDAALRRSHSNHEPLGEMLQAVIAQVIRKSGWLLAGTVLWCMCAAQMACI